MNSPSPRFLVSTFTTAILLATLTATAAAQELLPAVDFVRGRSWAGEFWPGDFDGDGTMDLAVRHRESGLVTIASLDGSEIRSSTAGFPRAVADVNRDGSADVIAQTNDGVVVLPGNGDGTLGPPRTVLDAEPSFVIVADMDGDGHRDVVIGEEPDSLHVVPGNGDLTFRPAVTMTTGTWPHGADVADFNGDDLPDVAVAHRYDRRLVIFRNNGGFLFTPSDIPLDHSSTDVTARDIDGDRRVDLAVSLRSPQDGDSGFNFGAVDVFSGNGDGTFSAPSRYSTPNGPISVAVGDFTHDGRLDLATTNGPQFRYDNSCGPEFGQHSVSILPGNADGTFGPPTSFAVENDAPIDAFGALNTSDMNGDGYPDLLVGSSYVLLSDGLRRNSPPIVAAGHDWIIRNTSQISLTGSAVDPDNHYLTYSWSDGGAGGGFYAQLPTTCYQPASEGTFTITLTADDGHGGVASDSLNISYVPSEDGPDIIGQPIFDGTGSVTYEDGVYTVSGSGTDIWGDEDDFYYVHLNASGDFDFTAHVTSVENVHRWTKAGLMLRRGLGTGSEHVSIFATPTTEKGLAFQRRLEPEGQSVHTAGPAIAPPVWLRLSRRGSTITAYYRRTEADTWRAIGSETLAPHETDRIGLAVTSHVDGATEATATFAAVALERVDDDPDGLPPGWSSRDVGAVAAVGSASYDSGTFTIDGSGADIWGTADEFHFVARQVVRGEGAVELTARVTSVENVNRWTKVGIMVRDHFGASSAHAMLIVTPTTEKGVAFQRRPADGGQSVHTAGPSLTAPIWLKLVVVGQYVRAYYRKEATDRWTFIGEQSRAVQPDVLEVGLVVSSHVDGTLATATFDNVSVVEQQFALDSRDIGAVAVPGTFRRAGDLIYQIDGSGADIWGTADAFHFVSDSDIDSFPVGERGRISARVLSVENTHRWAKAGVMIRESDAAGSAHVMVVVTPGMGIAMQYRTADGGTSSSFTPITGAAPAWVRLTRNGSTFVGEASLNGVEWQEVGRVEVTMAPVMRTTLAGLAVTSHNNTTLATAEFDDIRFEPMP